MVCTPEMKQQAQPPFAFISGLRWLREQVKLRRRLGLCWLMDVTHVHEDPGFGIALTRFSYLKSALGAVGNQTV